MTNPVFVHKSHHMKLDEVSELSAMVSKLKRENEELQQTLNIIVNGQDQTKYTKFKRAEMEFSLKLQQRELELENFAKFMNDYRGNSNPTFVEVQTQRLRGTRTTGFDAINASLLVSNQQRSFFTKDDIEGQNDELKLLIEEQEQTLRLLDARLKLFSNFQNANTAQFTIDSLKRGCAPTALASRAPTVSDELNTKHKALTAELLALIKERKALTAKRVAQKLMRRKKRERIKKKMESSQELPEE